jgi:hypothetical protein
MLRALVLGERCPRLGVVVAEAREDEVCQIHAAPEPICASSREAVFVNPTEPPPPNSVTLASSTGWSLVVASLQWGPSSGSERADAEQDVPE